MVPRIEAHGPDPRIPALLHLCSTTEGTECCVTPHVCMAYYHESHASTVCTCFDHDLQPQTGPDCCDGDGDGDLAEKLLAMLQLL